MVEYLMMTVVYLIEAVNLATIGVTATHLETYLLN